MFQKIGSYLVAFNRRVFSRWIRRDRDESFSNVIDLICGKSDEDSSESNRLDGESNAMGKLFLFQTREQLAFDRLEKARKQEKKDQEQARIETLASKKTILLAKRDPRFQQCCEEYFREQPLLAKYLQDTVIASNGSFQVLRLICMALANAFPKMNGDVPVEIVGRMRCESSSVETERLVVTHWRMIGCNKIQDRAHDLGMELQGVIQQKDLPKDQQTVVLNNALAKDQFATYVRIFICAHVMLLATQASCRDTHAA